MSPELKALVGDTHLTPSQLKLLEVLKDGRRHDRHELRKILEEEDFMGDLQKSSLNILTAHILKIRPKLPNDQALVCEYWQGGYHYRWIRLLFPNVYMKYNDPENVKKFKKKSKNSSK